MFREFGTITSFCNEQNEDKTLLNFVPTPHFLLRKWYYAYFRIYVISKFGNIGDNLDINIYRF